MAGGLVITGVETHVGGLRQRAKDDFRKTYEIIFEAAHIIRRRIEPLIPVEFGDLKATLHVEGAVRGFSSEADVVAGGVAPSGRVVDYAFVVNERTDLGHDPPTGAKFMERGVRAAMPFVKRWVGAAFTHDGPIGVIGPGSAGVREGSE
jgi:hypothetical protein